MRIWVTMNDNQEAHETNITQETVLRKEKGRSWMQRRLEINCGNDGDDNDTVDTPSSFIQLKWQATFIASTFYLEQFKCWNQKLETTKHWYSKILMLLLSFVPPLMNVLSSRFFNFDNLK